MNTNALFLTNVICPLLSGIPLLCFAFYFFYAGQGLFRARARLFPAFLLAFSLFILGRPLQLLAGPYPWPIYINCLRAILFIGICCPLVLHEARALCGVQGRRSLLRPLLLVGGALATLNSVVLLAGPADTPLVFELGSLKAYDCTPRSLTPPLFAREVTILIQVAAGLGFFGLAGYETLKARRAVPASEPGSRHLLYFALGCLVFGAALVLGTLTHQWWFYYLASVPAAFFIGLGVREDMLYVRQRVERVTPFLRDELFHSLGSGSRQEAKVQELKELLGKQVLPTLVLAIGWEQPDGTGNAQLTAQEASRQRLAEALDEEVGEAGYLLLPVGPGRFAVCLDLGEDRARALAEKLRARLVSEPTHRPSSWHNWTYTVRPVVPTGLPIPRNEPEHRSKEKRTEGNEVRRVAVGIGGTHPPQELQHSYLQAQTALRAAEQSGQSIVSYIDLGAMPSQRRFPIEARDEFLLEFKHVHHDAARQRLQVLLDQVAIHAEGDAVAYRVSLLELLGTILGRLGEQARRPALRTDAASAFERLNRLETIDDLTAAFTATVDTLLRHVEAPQVETTAGNPLQRAQAYIGENLAEDLKVPDVARRAGVSTSQLQRIFRDALGMTYSTYLTTMRMQKAKALLAGTDRPITDIAFDVGYNDSTYFSTAFRKHAGLSPSQYRKQGAK